MTGSVDLSRDAEPFDRAGLAVFAAGCALHVSGLLLEFSAPGRREEVQHWLAQLRDLAAGGDLGVARRLKAAAESAPEAEADDSNSPDYYAMRALSITAYAAEVWFAGEPLKYAQWSADEAAELVRDISHTLAEAAPPLERLVMEAQRALVADLRVVPAEPVVAVLGRAAEDPVVSAMRSAAVEYARVRGWTI